MNIKWTVWLWLFPHIVGAQVFSSEAIRFSNTQPQGTARIQALGGASVSLGADATTLYTNPAGLGLYNSWEVSFTPSVGFNTNTATLNGSQTNSNLTMFALGQGAMVLSNPARVESDIWYGGNWAFGFQKLNDFNNRFSYRGSNSANSLIDFFIEDANGSPASDFPFIEDAFDLTSLAYYNYLIGPTNVIDASFPDDEYFSDVTSFVRPWVEQQEFIETTGSQYAISLGYGGNFADVFYLGANVSLINLKYGAEKSYSEFNYDYSASDPSYLPLKDFNATEKLTISGTGANLALGFIFRPIPAFRVGLSYTTPTLYSVNDSFETAMDAHWNNFYYQDVINGDTLLTDTSVESAIIESVYNIRTPAKLSVGAAIFFGKHGFATADLEFINYAKTHLSSIEFSMDSENYYISTNYSKELNVKTGMEWRISPLRLRAGYSLNAVPQNEDSNLQFSSQSFSAGAGVLLNQFFGDFALVYKQNKSQYAPYLLSDFSEPVVDLKLNRVSLIFTVGYKF